MSSVCSVIFDMDGVLVDSAAAHARAWQQLGDEVGVEFSAAMFERTFGQRNASIIPLWLGADVPPERIAALGDRKEEIYRALVRGGAIRIYDRVPAIFAELRSAGVGVAIASSGPRANVALLAETMGAGSSVEVLVAAEDVSAGKPDPEAFLVAAQRLGVAPAQSAVIEDSVHGIEAARRAGMLPVAVLTSTPRAALAAAGAALFVDEVGSVDVAALCRTLAGRSGGLGA